MKNYEYRLNLVTKYIDGLSLSDKIKEYFNNRTILVTGGAGAIGSNLVIALANLVGDNEGISANLNNIGYYYLYKKEYDKAMEFFTSKFNLEKKLDNKHQIGFAYYSFGYVFNRINAASNDKVLYGNATTIHAS